MKIKEYITIARPDHWFKNIFILPGTAIAALVLRVPPEHFVWPLVLGMASACLIASSNYIINEVLDAEFDKFHPEKKSHPMVTGRIKPLFAWSEYILVLAIGLCLASLNSPRFFAMSIIFAAMGIIYNVKPFRTKEIAHLDIISESAMNPIRLMLGWFIVTDHPIPPSSLVFAYWMGGAFLMTMKRYAELKSIGKEAAASYRRSFRYYTENRLLVSAFFYSNCTAFFLGVFLVKNRIELLLSLPFLAYLFASYFKIGLAPNSTAQHPERLIKEKFLMLFLVLLSLLILLLFYTNMPALNLFLENSFSVKP